MIRVLSRHLPSRPCRLLEQKAFKRFFILRAVLHLLQHILAPLSDRFVADTRLHVMRKLVRFRHVRKPSARYRLFT